MNYTTNLNLNKPEKAEQFNIDHWNDNMDTIDTAVQGEIDTRTSQVQTLTQNLGDEVTARQNGVEDAKNLVNATGVLTVSKGGTGMSTEQDAIDNLFSTVASPSSLLSTDAVVLKRGTSIKVKDLDSFATKIYELIRARIATTVPVGVIYPFTGEYGENYENVPDGYLACDGRAISRTEYATLFSVIGTKYGNGDEITTFNLPDLREAVMVGAGQSTRAILSQSGHSHDVYTLGEFKDDQIQNITGRMQGGGNNLATQGAFYDGGAAQSYDSGNFSNRYGLFDASRVARTGTTTHGKQLGVNYIIKY